MNRFSLLLSLPTSFAVLTACHDPIAIGDQPGADGGPSADAGVAHDAEVARDAARGPGDASLDGPQSPADASVAFGYFFANSVDNGQVDGVPAGGGAAVALATGGATSRLGGLLTFDDRSVYYAFADGVNAAGVSTYALGALPIAGGPTVTLASSLNIVGLAVDSNYLYFLDQGTGPSMRIRAP